MWKGEAHSGPENQVAFSETEFRIRKSAVYAKKVQCTPLVEFYIAHVSTCGGHECYAMHGHV